MRAHTGLSHLPQPVDMEAFSAALDRHYPRGLLRDGIAGTTLVDVHVDATGRVLDVDVVPRRSQPAHATHRAVLSERDPATGRSAPRVLDLADRPEFGAAAQAALRETRFSPALKDGKPVPHRLRMTVQFVPPATR